MLTVYISNESKKAKPAERSKQSFSCLGAFGEQIRFVEQEEVCFTDRDAVPEGYVLFLRAGDEVRSDDDGKGLLAAMEKAEYPIIRLENVGNTIVIRDKSEELSLAEQKEFVPRAVDGLCIRTDVLQNRSGDEEFGILYAVYRTLCENPILYYEKHVKTEFAHVSDSKVDCAWIRQKKWYLEFAEDFLVPLAVYAKSAAVPQALQEMAYDLLWLRYRWNTGNSNKHIIDEEYPQFEAMVKEFLQCISDEVILEHKPKHFTISSLQLKHGASYQPDYQIVEEDGKKDILVSVCGDVIQRISELKCVLYNLDYEAKTNMLTIEFQMENYADLSKFETCVEIGGRKLPVEETYRFSHVKYFSIGVQKDATFRTVVDLNQFPAEGKKNSTIVFSLIYGSAKVELLLEAQHYTAMVTSLLKSSYWHFGDYILNLSDRHTCMWIEKAWPLRLLGHEMSFFFKNVFSKTGVKSFALRALYWLTRPYFRKKTIWLTYDKLYKGGDCGEYMYRYMCTREKETGILAAYVINGDTPDYEKLVKEGYKPLAYGSIRHMLTYLNSSVVFTTHGGVYNFNAISKRAIPYLQNLLHHDVACIQHGLTVQQLANNSNRLFNNMKRYYCASKYEIANLSRPIYGYEDKSMLKLTGIPRYDGLVNHDKHQILITPTWRNYISMPAVEKNEAKPYFAGFKNTNYFKIYNRLLSDERLIETAKKTGYKLIYLLHPVISAQLKDYPKNEAVEIIPALTVNYEKILTESSLMVTDYSGVQFDFAYMRKPVVYYHPPLLPPHYKEGGFFYDTQGFGEICKEHDEIVNTLCEYMETGCKLKPFYRERQDDFFAFSDLNSCQRIYDDMLAYQKGKKKEE